MEQYNFIAIEGNIGAGKTSLATKLAQQSDAKLILEEFADNPFLPFFYNDPLKYAFQLEMSFLAERYQQLKENLPNQDLFKKLTVSDYLFNKCLIFARVNLQEEEYKLFSKLYNIIYPVIPKPDLIIYLYLNNERLQKNIQKRGRDYEQAITNTYLKNVQTSYFEFFRHQKDTRILVIDTSDIDFVANESDYQRILDTINREYTPGMHQIIL